MTANAPESPDVPTIADGGTSQHVAIHQEHPGGPASIVIAGQDVSRYVSAVHLDLGGDNKIPYVVLELTPQVARDGFLFHGMARVVIGEAPDPGPAAAAFLAAMDWKQLEQAALNRPDLENDEGGLTRAMLAQLQDWARGRA